MRSPFDASARTVKLSAVVVALALLAMHPASSLAQPVQRLDAAEFLGRFRRSEPRLARLVALVESARAEVAEARIVSNPSLSYDREEVFASGEAFPENVVRLTVPLNVLGPRARDIHAADLGVGAAGAEVAHQRNLLALDALEVFTRTAWLRLRLEALRQEREALARVITIVRARATEGEASQYDLQRLDLELAADDDAVSEAEIELAAARIWLGRLVGDAGGAYDAADALEVPALPPDARALVTEALHDRQDRRGARLRVRQADEALSSTDLAWVPEIALTGGVKTTDLGTEVAIGYTAGIALGLPLFEHGQAPRARARALRTSTRAEERRLDLEIPAEVRTAREVLARRIAQARAYEESLAARVEELLRRAEVTYREGERPIFDLLDAHRTARGIRLRSLELRHAARRSQLDLWRAIGRRP